MMMCGDRGCLAPAAAPLAQRQLFRRPQHALRVVAKSKGGSSGSGRASPQGSNGQGGSKKPAGIRLTDRLQEKSIDIIQDFAPDGHDWSHTPDVLYLPNLRKKLHPRPSPFVVHNYFGGGFVSDEDRVYLASLVHGAGADESGGIRHSRTDSLEEGASAWAAGRASMAGEGAMRATISPEESEEFLGWEEELAMPRFALRSGPRETIYYNPRQTNIAIVTVGGLCPGTNDVIRSIVSKASDYGVPEGNIRGIQFGFEGFHQASRKRPLRLTRATTDEVHMEGGTMLGTSRTKPNLREIIKWLDLWSIDMLFVVGGIGGISVAHEIMQECERCNVLTSVIAVPKSIDNDILLIDKTFGFDTVVEEARKALLAAKVEASSTFRGIGLVKLMGRTSGFIAVKASLASGLVDVCLIPEVRFKLDGDNGLVQHLERLLELKGHAMICVAEGAAQDLIPDGQLEYESEGDTMKDEREGHAHIIKDVGPWLKSALKQRMKDIDVKYIDPSYLIRSVPPTSNDRLISLMLAHGAVHAAFAGYTGTMVGLVNTHYVLLPLAAGKVARQVDPNGALWHRLRATCGQPNFDV